MGVDRNMAYILIIMFFVTAAPSHTQPIPRPRLVRVDSVRFDNEKACLDEKSNVERATENGAAGNLTFHDPNVSVECVPAAR